MTLEENLKCHNCWFLPFAAGFNCVLTPRVMHSIILQYNLFLCQASRVCAASVDRLRPCLPVLAICGACTSIINVMAFFFESQQAEGFTFKKIKPEKLLLGENIKN